MFEDALNDAQRRAATHGGGPLLIVAGAGTGKTTTLASRVAWLLANGVAPERLLLLTFSRRAAREMTTRAERIAGASDADVDASRIWSGTFHAIGNRLLRLHGRALGLDPSFTVLDQADSADVMNLLRDELGFSGRERRFPRKETLAGIYSRTVNAGEKLGDVLKRHYPWCLDEADAVRAIFAAYTERKRSQHALDYDDLLLFWKALATSDTTRSQLAEMFDHVLVDEYQDTNALQADILEGLRPEDTPRNLTVVGDDAQSIYGFRAATVRNILEFPTRFPGAAIVRLEQNYRSTPPILETSNAVIALSPQRHEKTLWSARRGDLTPTLRTCLDEAEQCAAVCGTVLAHREEGVPLKEQAVLFRAAHHSDHLEVELARRNIPFVKYGGLKFMEAAHVKDTLALMRVLENPHDEVAWFRVLQLPESMGPATSRRLMDAIGVRGADGASPLTRFLDEPHEVPKAALEGVQDLRSALRGCSDETTLAPAAQIERLRVFLAPVFARRYDASAARLRDLDQLTALAVGYGTRGRFLSELTLDPPSSTGDLAGPPHLDEDWLVLSTIHSAKGLEWDVVHVIHAADGMIPSDMATGDDDQIEEERRLLYVALTRSRDALHVYRPMRYYRRPKGDPHSYSQLSRFLEPPDVRSTFEETGPAVDPADPPVVDLTGTVDVDSYLAGLWSE
ncbi:MAG: ATP-dependent helicase [Actinomycetota bacterium]|nr:ATP-dependent helicase [Actinomycetota bacterium]MDH5224255.1 ATP-dependent helicase [Actinomycetota bacterium]MDH5312364.1 ATP-dependent helicase [Actinomycetota bacterium]